MPRRLGVLAAVVLLAGVGAPRAGGDVLPPEWFHGYTFEYAISWNGIPAAQSRVVLTSQPDAAEVQTHQLDLNSWTLPVLNLIWPARSTVHAAVAEDLTSRRFHIFRHERNTEQSTSITFRPLEGIVHILRRKADGEIKEVVRPLADLQDPVGMMYTMRQQPTAVGTEHTGKVVVGDDVYRVTLTVVTRDTIRIGHRRVPVVCVEPTAVKLRDNGQEKRVANVRGVRVWVTDDALRLPVRLQASAFIGRVTMALRASSPPLEDLYAELDARPHLVAGRGAASASG